MDHDIHDCSLVLVNVRSSFSEQEKSLKSITKLKSKAREAKEKRFKIWELLGGGVRKWGIKLKRFFFLTGRYWLYQSTTSAVLKKLLLC